jgi:hypothetical protein
MINALLIIITVGLITYTVDIFGRKLQEVYI